MPSLSVLTLNLRFGLADDGPNAWEYRKKAVVRLFEACAPDLIATQEANHFQVDYLTANLTQYRHIGKRHPAPSFWQHNIIFHRAAIPCIEHLHFFLSETPNVPSRSYDSRFPRQGTLGLFDAKGLPLICINTHFDFDDRAQMGAARVIKQHMACYSTNVPAILMGDFNTTPESPCYRWLTGKTKNRDAGMDFNETFTQPYPSTFHGFTGKPVAGYIDWILFRGPIRLKSCRVMSDAVDGVLVSDHHPVEAVFEW
jgi:endonuclease/exonuclease/phosphatase family metal-dependent hydrolase